MIGTNRNVAKSSRKPAVFKSFDAEFGRAALAVNRRTPVATASKRSHRKLRRWAPRRPSYMLNEAEYIRLVGWWG
jgi:hypothetical protein